MRSVLELGFGLFVVDFLRVFVLGGVVVGIWFRFSGSVAAVAFVDVVAATAAVMSRRSRL